MMSLRKMRLDVEAFAVATVSADEYPDISPATTAQLLDL